MVRVLRRLIPDTSLEDRGPAVVGGRAPRTTSCGGPSRLVPTHARALHDGRAVAVGWRPEAGVRCCPTTSSRAVGRAVGRAAASAGPDHDGTKVRDFDLDPEDVGYLVDTKAMPDRKLGWTAESWAPGLRTKTDGIDCAAAIHGYR